MKRAIPLIKEVVESSHYTKRGILAVVDTTIIIFSLWASVSLRVETFWPSLWDDFFWLFFALPLISLPIFYLTGMYRAIIRYTSLDNLWLIFVGVFCSALTMVLMLVIVGFTGFPRSVPFIYFLLALTLLGSSRLIFRSIYSKLHSNNRIGKRVLIYGAGSSGRQMAIAFQNSSDFYPACFVDDLKTLQKRKLLGLSIHAPEQIGTLLEKYSIDLILLSMPSVKPTRKKEILRFLGTFSVEVKSLPSLDRLVLDDLSIKDIQEIQIEDLLGRDQVAPHLDLLKSCIGDKNVMVTGAGGSIGSELCRQIAENKPKCLVLFERSELALYTIEAELRSQFGKAFKIIPVLGSVTHKRRVAAVIKALAVQTIYHSAAYKHVPLVEYNPIEGVCNNVFGTLKTAEAAIEGDVETFVLISTDKAVRPTNVMGASKRMAELVLQAFAARGEKTRFTMVRFGNVLDSSGSVVPFFRKQIKNGGPVTVTHPDVVRYFMTIPEAVQLVIQAGSMGNGGDVFVLDMGEPLRILDMAQNMIRLCGLSLRDPENPAGDIGIEFIGLRPGEKLYEELLVGDNAIGTPHPMIMRAEEQMLSWEKFSPVLEDLDQSCKNFDHQKVRDILLETVDGFTPQCDIIDPVWLKRGNRTES